MMTKCKAKCILKRQKAAMTAYTAQFHIETLSYMEAIFGKDSEQYRYIAKIQPFRYEDPLSFANDRGDIELFFDRCIIAINDGMMKKQVKPPWEIVIKRYVLPFGIGLLAGYIFGAYNNPSATVMYVIKGWVHLR